jgi:hypothetical protein
MSRKYQVTMWSRIQDLETQIVSVNSVVFCLIWPNCVQSYKIERRAASLVLPCRVLLIEGLDGKVFIHSYKNFVEMRRSFFVLGPSDF